MDKKFVTGKGRRRPLPPPPPKLTMRQRACRSLHLHPLLAIPGFLVLVLSLAEGVSFCQDQYNDLKPAFSAPTEDAPSLFDAQFGISNKGTFVGMYNLNFCCTVKDLTNSLGDGLGNDTMIVGHQTWLDPGNTAYYKCPIGQEGDPNSAYPSLLIMPSGDWISGDIQINVEYQIGVYKFGHWYTRSMKANSQNFFFVKTTDGYKWKEGTPIN